MKKILIIFFVLCVFMIGCKELELEEYIRPDLKLNRQKPIAEMTCDELYVVYDQCMSAWERSFRWDKDISMTENPCYVRYYFLLERCSNQTND